MQVGKGTERDLSSFVKKWDNACERRDLKYLITCQTNRRADKGVCTFLLACVCMLVYVCVCMLVYVCVCMLVYVCMHVCVCVCVCGKPSCIISHNALSLSGSAVSMLRSHHPTF